MKKYKIKYTTVPFKIVLLVLIFFLHIVTMVKLGFNPVI